jgi:hypothetical protein
MPGSERKEKVKDNLIVRWGKKAFEDRDCALHKVFNKMNQSNKDHAPEADPQSLWPLISSLPKRFY